MDRQPWSQDDLMRAVRAAQELRALGVWTAYTDPLRQEPGCHVSRDTMLRVVAMTGTRPSVAMTQSGRAWEAAVVVDGVRFTALFQPDELPLIGYQVTPIPEPVQLEEAAPNG